jgi:hypothetical protein
MDNTEAGDTLGPLAPGLAAAALAVARRFAAGATLWCWAPDRHDHAQHVAVEFVHPVIVGKRALPAVAVAAPAERGADELRPLVATGDVVLVVGGERADAGVADVLRRAPAWGATTVWLGAGARPPAGAADHVLWLADETGLAVHDGRLVLLYHVLWELTHVCFEHPGLLSEPAPCDEGTVCVTCSDEGRLAEVLDDGAFAATVRTATGVEEVDTSIVGEVRRGDLLLVHAGTAITVVDGP